MATYDNQAKYIKKKINRVVINTSIEEREEWEKAAKAEGIPLATLIRKLMKEHMQESIDIEQAKEK